MPFDGKRMFWGGFEKIVDTASRPPRSKRARPSPPDKALDEFKNRRSNHD